MTAFSRTGSASKVLRRAVSLSSAFSRLASALVLPPNVLRHREFEPSLQPCVRHSAVIGRPASASRQKPMLCSARHRVFLSNRRPLRHWMPNQPVTQHRADGGTCTMRLEVSRSLKRRPLHHVTLRIACRDLNQQGKSGSPCQARGDRDFG